MNFGSEGTFKKDQKFVCRFGEWRSFQSCQSRRRVAVFFNSLSVAQGGMGWLRGQWGGSEGTFKKKGPG